MSFSMGEDRRSDGQTTLPCFDRDGDPCDFDPLAEGGFETFGMPSEPWESAEVWQWDLEDTEEFQEFLKSATRLQNSAQAQTTPKETAKPSSTALSDAPADPSPPTRTTTCPICLQVFHGGDELELHAMKERHRSFPCTVEDCDKRFFRRDMRTRHVAAHDGSKHVCSVCQTKFGRRDHLTRHVRVQHPDEISNPEAKAPGFADADMKKVKESELALRRCLSPDNLAIKMLDIAKKFGSTEKGAQKAFACVVAHAALHDAEPLRPLTPRTKRRLMSVQTEPAIDVQDLDTVETLEVA